MQANSFGPRGVRDGEAGVPTSRASHASSVHSAAFAALRKQAPDHDHDGADPVSLCRPLVEAGVFRDVLPLEQGGRGWATSSSATDEVLGFLLDLGGADLSAGRLFEGHLNAVKLVWRFGSADQRRACAEDVLNGAVAGVWNAEVRPGARLSITPARGRRAVIEGGKIFCSGLGIVTRPVFTARTPDEDVLMLAPGPLDSSRFNLADWKVQGMRATATGSVDLTGVMVGEEDVVGAPGDFYRSPAFKGGAWRFAALHAGAVGRLAALTRAELRARGRDGDPHQTARLGALAIAAETAELWVTRAAQAAESGEWALEAVDAYVSLARTAVERAATEAVAIAQRALGLSALTRPNAVERIARDLLTYLRQPFPDAALDEAARFLNGAPEPAPWSRVRSAAP